MEFRDLRSLVTLADLGSIAKVAEKLHLTPPAIHKQLKSLEAELEVRLYEKVGRNLRLTQAADVVIPHARDLLAEHDAAIAAVEEWRGLKQGVVRIGAGPATGSYVLPPLLKKFRRSYPKIDLLVEAGNSLDLIDKLGSGALDLALLVSSHQPEEASLCMETSLEMELVFVSNLPQTRRHCSIRELSRFPFILFRRSSRMQRVIDRYFAEVNFHPSVIMAFDNADAIKAMVRAGLGISMLPFWVVDQDLKEGHIFLIRQKERALFSKLDLVRRKSNYLPAPVAAFIAMTRTFEFKHPRLTSR